jgi:ribosomal protein L34
MIDFTMWVKRGCKDAEQGFRARIQSKDAEQGFRARIQRQGAAAHVKARTIG